jgi:4-amino-4-deoxy-L-arabinose transferase-like glycosyltransferase
MQNSALKSPFQTKALLVLFFLMLSRLFAMIFIPLNDSTEARYGEIARKMLETGNWVTPLHDYGVPFWAKPPLSTWLSAFSMKIFGVNEFAARLPALLLSIVIVWLVWDLVKKYKDAKTAIVTTLFLSGSLYFFLDSGTVMTDPALLFSITLSMVAFWHAFKTGSKIWGYLFFTGLGLGLLAKGPISTVLIGMPIFFWVLITKQWKTLWQKLPWFSGVCLMLAIALPWYILAEYRTPGFLQYFIVGEHFSRFWEPGWAGDKYGSAHIQPHGMIFVYAFTGFFPWTLIALLFLIVRFKKFPTIPIKADTEGWSLFLLCWALLPLLFFSLAGNIIYPYVFPCLPPMAILFAELWMQSKPQPKNETQLLFLASIIGSIFLIGTCLFISIPSEMGKSQKIVIKAWRKQDPTASGTLIYWSTKPDYSANFYTAGKVKAVENVDKLKQLLTQNNNNYIIIKEDKLHQIPDNLLNSFVKLDAIKMRKITFILFKHKESTMKS